jgi:hypothetical protein
LLACLSYRTKLDFIHLVIGPRQLLTSGMTSGEGFERSGEYTDM